MKRAVMKGPFLKAGGRQSVSPNIASRLRRAFHGAMIFGLTAGIGVVALELVTGGHAFARACGFLFVGTITGAFLGYLDKREISN
jgi:hypothetical protein